MKNNKVLKQIIYGLALGLLAAVMAQFIIESLQRFGFTTIFPPVAFLLIGTGILFTLYIFFTGLLGSAILGSVGLVVTALVLGSINRAKIHYRAEPLYPNDFAIVTEVSFFIEMIGWFYSILIVLSIILGIIFMVRFYHNQIKPRKKHFPKKLEGILRIVSVILTGWILFYLSEFHEPDHALHAFYREQGDWLFEAQLTDYQNNGFIAGFLANLQGQPMAEPTDYSKERVTEIHEKYRQKAADLNADKGETALDTNILFVMNESFSDPFNLEGIESNKDPLHYFRQITEETLHGQILSPTFGGGTNANEFQALTGFSLEPLNPQITSPYMQLNEKIGAYPTIAKKLNTLNYRTTAIHPYDKSFFKRDQVYEKMGFAEFLHEDNMVNLEYLSKSHLFISDASAYREVFEVLETSVETDFIHVVTMQNHTPYADKYETVDYQVAGSGNDAEAAGYFQDLANSDRALRQLIEQIDQHDEPILLVFWGDHLPGLYCNEVREVNDAFALRQTPFLVYSNQIDLEEEEEVNTTSPIYFQNWIYNWLDVELTAYDALLLELEAVLPMLDGGMYLESDEWVTSRRELSPETQKILEEYSTIMYDITTGNQYAITQGFFE